MSMYLQYTLSAYAFEEEQTVIKQENSDIVTTEDTSITENNETEIINGAELSTDPFSQDEQLQQN